METGLRGLGAELDRAGEAGLRIRTSRLRGGRVDSAGDHRTAMALSVAGLLAAGTTQVLGAECTAKSFRDFFTLLGSVTGPGAVTVTSPPS